MQDKRKLIPGIVLAAGESSRMGENKLLLPLGGKPILSCVLDTLLQSSLRHVYLVLGWDADRLRAISAPYFENLTIIENTDYRKGRASSIQAALCALHPSTPGALITPGDVPLISVSLIEKLLESFSLEPLITFPIVNGKKGHPVVFPGDAFNLLGKLQGDETLHDYILSHPARVRQVPWDDDGCLLDCDTPDDYRRICERK